MSCTDVVKLLDGLRVLVVEDEPLIGMAVEEAIRDAGGQAEYVDSDRAAYSRLQDGARTLDALIVDVNLGEGTTGFDVARFARRLNATLPVVYLSGGPEEWAAWFGVDDATFLAKPVTDAELVQTIARLSGREEGPPCQMPHPA